MKILFICEPISPHAARWINQFAGIDADIHIFSEDIASRSICPDLKCGTVYLPDQTTVPDNVKLVTTSASNLAAHVTNLIEIIHAVKPDIIHTLGMYVNDSNRCSILPLIRSNFPEIMSIPWIYSSWGMDLDWFAKQDSERELVTKAAASINYHISEGQRDINLFKDYGFNGKVLGTLPAFGGITWDIDNSVDLDKRKSVLIKARDYRDGDRIGRAFNIFPALLANVEILKDYRIIAIQAGKLFKEIASQISRNYGLEIDCPDRLPCHSDVLDYYRQARVWVGLTSNDGLPSSLVEAMSLGALPIHSKLNSIQEWFKDRQNGLLVDLDQSSKVSELLYSALTDDNLYNYIRSYNLNYVKQNWDAEKVRKKALQFYKQVTTEKANLN